MSDLSLGDCHSTGDGGHIDILGAHIRPRKPGKVGRFEDTKGCRSLELGIWFEIVHVWLSHGFDSVSEAP